MGADDCNMREQLLSVSSNLLPGSLRWYQRSRKKELSHLKFGAGSRLWLSGWISDQNAASWNLMKMSWRQQMKKRMKKLHAWYQNCWLVCATLHFCDSQFQKRSKGKSRAVMLCDSVQNFCRVGRVSLRGVPEFCEYIPRTVWPQLLQQKSECEIFFRLLEQHSP